MRVPAWKKLTSYLLPLTLETIHSDLHTELSVRLSRGQFQLCTEKAIYSFGNRYANFFKAFSKVDFDQLPGEQVLILGLGLGSIPLMLEKNYNRTFHYCSVEVDEAVGYLAEKYVLSDLKSSMETFIMDARLYLETTDQSFDLICMDIFMEDIIPEDMQSSDFIQEILEHLNPGGLLLYNVLDFSAENRRDNERFLETTWQPLFPDGGYMAVHANWILFNDRRFVEGG